MRARGFACAIRNLAVGADRGTRSSSAPSGERLRTRPRAAFEHHVVDLTGGITRRADVEGIWRRPDGTMQRERSRSYVTTVDAAVAERVATDIDALIRMQFRQLASYITATPTTAAVF